MTDRELRELCTRYFDSIEARDVDAVARLYAPGFTFWVNLTGATSSREENLKTLREGYAVLRRRTYDDRIVDTFPGGFLARYSVNVVRHDGKRGSFSAAVVARCHAGQIVHIDEYLDSSKFLRTKPEEPRA